MCIKKKHAKHMPEDANVCSCFGYPRDVINTRYPMHAKSNLGFEGSVR